MFLPKVEVRKMAKSSDLYVFEMVNNVNGRGG